MLSCMFFRGVMKAVTESPTGTQKTSVQDHCMIIFIKHLL